MPNSKPTSDSPTSPTVSDADHWVKCISVQGALKGVAVDATALTRYLATQHKIEGIAAQGLGEALVGALLVASTCKTGQRMNLNIQASGLIKQALVDAYPNGTVRGYVIPRDGLFLLGGHQGPWGEGLLSVLRTKDQEGQQPYIGTVPLLTGHLAKDLSFYWHQSEQVPSGVGLFVHLEKDQVVSAKGFLVQAMPGATEQEIASIDEHMKNLNSFMSDKNKGVTPKSLLSEIFQNTPFIVLEEKPIAFQCTCSWERVRRALSLIGLSELQAMALEKKPPEIRCEFCTKEYNLSSTELDDLIRGMTAPH